MNYKRFENETDDELIYRICSQKDIIGTWCDVCNILNNLTGNDYNESAYRKKYQSFQKILNANQAKFADSSVQLSQIKEEQRNLIKERNKLQTEKIEYNKWLRETARDELLEEKIIDAINNLEPLDIPEKTGNHLNPIEYILTIADLHYGKELKINGLFGETLNEYSPEICERRLWDLANKVIVLIKKEQIDCLRIYNLSDNIEGILRLSQLMKLRYGVIDATIKISEILANWLNYLSQYTKIKYAMCMDGNHDEIRSLIGKKGTFVDDNINKIIFMFIKERLKDNPNFEILEQHTEMIFDNVCGYNILACHGDTKNLIRAIKDYSSIYGVNIDYLFAGHMHHSSQEDTGINSEVIMVPSIIGIDDFSMKLRKTSNSAAKIFGFETGLGKIVEYTYKLK